MRKKSLPPRPAEDFCISSIHSNLAIEKTHRDAGFPVVSEVVVRRRFCQFIRFLQQHGMTTQQLIAEGVTPLDLDLRNHDLTDLGFKFAQRFHDRWIGRLYKDRGEEAEEKFLTKWFAEFIGPAN